MITRTETTRVEDAVLHTRGWREESYNYEKTYAFIRFMDFFWKNNNNNILLVNETWYRCGNNIHNIVDDDERENLCNHSFHGLLLKEQQQHYEIWCVVIVIDTLMFMMVARDRKENKIKDFISYGGRERFTWLWEKDFWKLSLVFTSYHVLFLVQNGHIRLCFFCWVIFTRGAYYHPG